VTEPRPVPRPVPTPALPPELFDALADILTDALVASYRRAHPVEPAAAPGNSPTIDNAYRQA